jgi:hypothetical protein
MNILQQVKNEDQSMGSWMLTSATRDAKAMFVNACSEVNKPLSTIPVFSHEGCQSDRTSKEMRFTIKPVDNQTLWEMGHKSKCHILNGQVQKSLRSMRSLRML